MTAVYPLKRETPPRLLLADDDEMVLLFIGEVLRQYYQVETAATAKQALDYLGQQQFDLLLLDLSLPDEDGLVLLRKLSMHNSLPVIVISGRSDDDNRIAALELGARDYLVKPFNPRELVLRIEKCLTYSQHSEVREPAPQARLGDWLLDMVRRTLVHGEEGEVHLTRAEFDLLSALVHADQGVLSRDELMDAISYGEQQASDSSLTVLVHRLRRKLSQGQPEANFIQTVAGVGYRLSC